MGHRSLRYQIEALALLRELDEPSEVLTGSDGADHLCEGFTAQTPRRPRTVAERARESMFLRLVKILSQIISIEQDLMGSLSEDPRTFLRRKDNIDLKNICLRMTLSQTGYQSDKDLKELRVCLQLIVGSLLCAVRTQNTSPSNGAVERLMGISGHLS